MSQRIQPRRDLAAIWAMLNPVLAQGELGLETDTAKAKAGDGTTPWNSLGYWSPAGPLGSAAFQAGSAFDAAGAAAAAAAASVPVAQTFTLANNAYQPVYEWTVSGQTDSPLPSFGIIAGSQTYSWHTGGESTQGPAFWFGINPRHLSGLVASSAHAALGISAFQDAGDTWNPATGGHGLEFNIAWVSPSGAKGVAPIEIVGADDETRTVTLALRCGDGQFTTHDSTQYVSGITMTDAAGNSYLSAGPFNNSAYGSVTAGTQPGVAIGAPLALTSLPYLYGTSAGAMTALFTTAGTTGNGALSWSAVSNNDSVTALFQGGTSATFNVYAVNGAAASTLTSAAGAATQSVTAQGTSSTAAFKATSSSGTAQFILNGNSAVSAQMVWQKNGVNTWVMQDSAGSSLYLTNNSGNPHFLLLSGTNTAGNYNNATTYILTKALVYGSLIVNNGGSALATTATQGFLYLPACAGTPTGVPAANTGALATVFDTTGGKPWYYQGGAWVAPLMAGSNLADLNSASTARTNLGLGSAALLASSAVAQTVNNLSDLASASVARTNLGLGTAATAALSSLLQAASNLSDVASPSLALGHLGGAALTGAAFTGEVTVQAPVNPSDAATKSYVDASVQGLQVKPTARLATTGALPANTYANGSSGVGATLTATGNGALTVDGTAVAAADLVLVKNEASAAGNGLYAVTQGGDASHPYILTRHADMDQPGEFPGAFIPVGSAGTVNANSLWLAGPSGTVTVGTTSIPLTQLNGATDLAAGTGITISGNTVALSVPVPAANGGTGAGTQQGAINNLAGAVTAGQYLRGNGTNVQMAAIQAADVPVLNQSTTGTAANVTATLDQVPAPAANVSLNARKLVSVANGTAGSDGAAYGQTPAGGNTVTIAQGGTGQTAQQAAINALTGTQSAGKVLRSDGTNATLDTIKAGDLPAATTSAQGAVTLDGTAGDIQALAGSAAAGSTGKAADAGHVHPTTGLTVIDSTAADIQKTGTAAAAGATGKAADAGHVHVQDFLGVFGDGSDGALVLDGTTTIAGMVPSGSVYTQTRSLNCTSLVINSGVTLQPAGYNVYCQGTISGAGTISAAGHNGQAGGTAGAATGSGTNGGGRPGGAGNTGAGSAGSNSGFGSAGAGGSGSSGAGGSAGTSSISLTSILPTFRVPFPAMLGVVGSFNSTVVIGTPGGGGGAGDGTNPGGGGGSGGGVIFLFAYAVNMTGAISAPGGNGGSPTTGNTGGGGPGSGGLIIAYTLSAWTVGSTSVAAGTAGTGHGTGSSGAAASAGQVLNVVLN